jgi:hypothetical protein
MHISKYNYNSTPTSAFFLIIGQNIMAQCFLSLPAKSGDITLQLVRFASFYLIPI